MNGQSQHRLKSLPALKGLRPVMYVIGESILHLVRILAKFTLTCHWMKFSTPGWNDDSSLYWTQINQNINFCKNFQVISAFCQCLTIGEGCMFYPPHTRTRHTGAKNDKFMMIYISHHYTSPHPAPLERWEHFQWDGLKFAHITFWALTLTALKYFRRNHGNQRVLINIKSSQKS